MVVGFQPHREPLTPGPGVLALLPLLKASKDTASVAGKAGLGAHSHFYYQVEIYSQIR